MTENLDPNIMYLEWRGSQFPNSSSAKFKAPAGSTIDWGDGTVETFDTDSPQVNTHTYNDGVDNHLIGISGVTSIGGSAFSGCSGLKSVVIPDSVTSIGGGAFSACRSLTSITIPDNVTSIGNRAFYKCSSLTNVEIPDSVTSIGQETFSFCSSLTSVAIGGSVTSIGEEAFAHCSSLTSVKISDSVTSIGQSAFNNCKSLTSVVIPDSVTSIGGWAFYDCASLTSVVIGNSVTLIGQQAFEGCSSLTSIMAFPATPPALSSDSLPSTIQSIYVQKSSAEAYKSASNWSSFADKIVGNTTYLSFVRFNQANKKYIDAKIVASENRKISASQLDIATQDDVLELLLESGSVSMAYASESELYTDEVGKIYIL